MIYGLNSLRWGYIGGSVGEYYRVTKAHTSIAHMRSFYQRGPEGTRRMYGDYKSLTGSLFGMCSAYAERLQYEQLFS